MLGVDLDGFLWARRRALPFVASLKGIIADELRNERGWVRALLSVQARWERRNVERADLVVVTSRYSAEVARREYGVPLERIAVVPEPIDLEVWDDQFWRAPRRPRNGPVVLAWPACTRASASRICSTRRRSCARASAGVQVRIVGRGPEWEALSRLHAELGLGDTVALLGDLTRERLAEEYVNARCSACPRCRRASASCSWRRWRPSCRWWPAGSRRCPRWCSTGATGLLVPPRDPGALAEAHRAADPRARAGQAPGAGGPPPRARLLPAARRGALPDAVHSTQDRLGQQARGG